MFQKGLDTSMDLRVLLHEAVGEGGGELASDVLGQSVA